MATFPRRFLPPMSILRTFETAARLQNFSAAASELGLTQSAVSRQIAVLEDMLGAEVFVRERRAVRLTQAGDAYARSVREALRIISGATVGFRANPAGGTLNLAILPTFGTRWLAPRLPAFIAAHPGVTVNLTTRLEPFDFSHDTVDAAVHFGRGEWSGARLEHLMHETVVPACSPALRQAHRFVEARDLLQAPLLHLYSRPDAWERWFQHHGVDAAQVHGMLLDQFAVAAQAAMSGLGVALLPEFLIAGELERGELVRAVDLPMQSAEAYYLAWPPARQDYPPLVNFRRWLRQAASADRLSAAPATAAAWTAS